MTNKTNKASLRMEKNERDRPINNRQYKLPINLYNYIKLNSKLPKDVIPRRTLNYQVSRLKKEGLIKQVAYGVWQTIGNFSGGGGVTPAGLKTIGNIPMEMKGSIKSDFIRIHNIQFRLKIFPVLSWRARFKDKGINFKVLKNDVLSFTLGNFRIWLCREKIIIYFLSSFDFVAANVYDSVYLAVKSFLAFLPLLEEALGLSLRIEGNYIWALDRKHLSLVKNAFATQLNKEGEKLRVYDDKGLWLLVDNSYNLNELEAVRSETNNREADVVQRFFNDLKNNPVLLSDLYNLIQQLTMSSVVMNNNLKELIEKLNRG